MGIAWNAGHNTPYWQGPVTGYPELRGEHTCRVCVVGLGGTGVALVRHLSNMGVDVIGIDAGRVAGGAAGRNGGLLLNGGADFYHETKQRLGHGALELYQKTMAELDDMINEGYATRTGSLRIAHGEAEMQDIGLMYSALKTDGLNVEWYEGVEGRGVLLADDGVFNPTERVTSIANSLREQARLFENSPAIAVHRDRVIVNRGVVRCNTVAVCVDGNLEKLVPSLAGTVHTARLQMLAVHRRFGERRVYTRPVYTRWGYDYWQELPGGVVLIGGGRDVGANEWLDEWNHQALPSQDVQAYLGQWASRLVPRGHITNRWAAAVGYSPKGAVAGLVDDIWVLGGYSGTGNLIGAANARRVAGEIMAVL